MKDDEVTKPRMTVVAFGHSKSGKSTLLGHLMFQCDAVDLDTIQRYEREAADAGKGGREQPTQTGVKYAWVFDTLNVERERRMTINITVHSFQSSRFGFTLIDTPGHANFIKNMITGISQADIGLFVVSAKSYELENHHLNTAPSHQHHHQLYQREHLVLAYSLGVPQLIVVVNQMDLVEYSEETYRFIRGQVMDELDKAGYDNSYINVTCIPTNAWYGENLVEATTHPKLSWYDGPTILQALDKCVPPIRQCNKPFRMPIQDVYKIGGIGTVVVGRIETGQIALGTKITIAPSGLSGVVKSIEIHHEPAEMARAGDNVGLNLKGIVPRGVKRGHVLSIVDEETPAASVQSFTAKVTFMSQRCSGKVTVGYRPVIDCHTAHVSCEFTRIMAKMDSSTGKILQDNPKWIQSGESCIVEMKPLTPLSIETFSDFPSLGRFAIRGDDKHTVAIGVVNSIVRAATATKPKHTDDSDDDSDDDESSCDQI